MMLWYGVTGAIVVVGAVGGYLLSQKKTPVTNTTLSNINVATVNDNTNSSTELNINTEVNTNTTNANTNTPGTSLGTVSWTTAKDVTTPKFYIVSPEPYSFDPNASATMQQIGTVTSGQYKGADIFRYSYKEDGPVFYPFYSYLLKQGAKYILLTKNSDALASYLGGPQLDTSLVTLNETDELPGLRFPTTLQGPKARQTLVQDASVNAEFSTEGLTKVYTDATYGAVYMKVGKLPLSVDYNSNASIDAFMAGTAFSTRNGFYLKAPDGTVRVYKLELDIYNGVDSATSQPIPDVTWTDGSKNTHGYNQTFLSGCGSLNYINAVPSGDLSVAKDLKKTGTTAQGDAIYELKDTNAKLLKDFYAATVFLQPGDADQKQVAYEKFLTMHPMIFWVDPFSRLIQLTNTQFSQLAECGKPVIYLYPTTTTNVDVQLAPKGGFTYTEPLYGQGWQVTATPDGKLTDRSTGKAYPYLFWEGRGGIYTPPTKGFTVAQADVHRFLVDSLTKLGLNTQETADFIAFWKPRMQGSPYYLVSFFGNRTMDDLAPLTVSPKPDTIIRVLMDFTPVSQPVNISPQALRAPTRTGFTVVEWGGVLR